MFSWNVASLALSQCIPLVPIFFLVRTTLVVSPGLDLFTGWIVPLHIGFHDLSMCYLFQIHLSLCQSTHYHPAPPSSGQPLYSHYHQGHVCVGSDHPPKTYSSVAPSLSQRVLASSVPLFYSNLQDIIEYCLALPFMTLLRHNLYIKELTHFQCTVQRFIVNLECATLI